jgi:hypothetical protein
VTLKKAVSYSEILCWTHIPLDGMENIQTKPACFSIILFRGKSETVGTGDAGSCLRAGETKPRVASNLQPVAEAPRKCVFPHSEIHVTEWLPRVRLQQVISKSQLSNYMAKETLYLLKSAPNVH